MFLSEWNDGIATLVFMTPTGNTEEEAPVINFCRTVCVHGAMDNNGRLACLVDFGDFADVFRVSGIGKAFVVDDDIIRVCPFRIVIEGNLCPGSFSAFIDNRELCIDPLLNAL